MQRFAKEVKDTMEIEQVCYGEGTSDFSNTETFNTYKLRGTDDVTAFVQ